MYLTFDNPIYLWLLFSVPLFIVSHFFFLRKSKSKAISFANFETLRRISQEKIPTKNFTHLILRLIVLIALIFSTAGTNLWYKGMSSDADFIIAIDTSSSMTAEDIKPTRFQAAKDYIRLITDKLNIDTKIGLISFGGVTMIEQTLTDDRVKFLLAIEKLQITDTGGTDIPGAIIIGTNLLASTENRGRTLIIISDGINTVKTFIADPVTEAVKYAKENQVVIHTIGVGSNSGPIGYLPEYYNISASFEGQSLENIAKETGGIYVNALSTEELVQAYDLIAQNKSEKYIRINISFASMFLALILLFVEWGLSNTVYRRVM